MWTKPWCDHDLVTLLGGLNGTVHFKGAGSVQYGAEPTAAIGQVLAGSVEGGELSVIGDQVSVGNNRGDGEGVSAGGEEPAVKGEEPTVGSDERGEAVRRCDGGSVSGGEVGAKREGQRAGSAVSEPGAKGDELKSGVNAEGGGLGGGAEMGGKGVEQRAKGQVQAASDEREVSGDRCGVSGATCHLVGAECQKERGRDLRAQSSEGSKEFEKRCETFGRALERFVEVVVRSDSGL